MTLQRLARSPYCQGFIHRRLDVMSGGSGLLMNAPCHFAQFLDDLHHTSRSKRAGPAPSVFVANRPFLDRTLKGHLEVSFKVLLLISPLQDFDSAIEHRGAVRLRQRHVRCCSAPANRFKPSRSINDSFTRRRRAKTHNPALPPGVAPARPWTAPGAWAFV